MKLIDADKLKEDLKTHFDALYREDGELLASDHICNSEDVNDLVELVNKQPTAYDVDNVVKELESLVEDREEDIINDEYTFGECSAYESAIRVVKRGVVDDISSGN